MDRHKRHIVIRLAALAWLALGPASAQAGPDTGGRFADRGPMFAVAVAPLIARPTGAPAPRGSLFPGTGTSGLFDGIRPRDLLGRGASVTPVRTQLRDLIARAEAGQAGYDAVQNEAHVPPPRLPTRMTLRDIFGWIDATPGQHHAIGRYQIIPATLRRLVTRAGLGSDMRFSPSVQDRLADMLLDDAGLDAVRHGEITRAAFGLNLAKVWAGLPTASGRSYYHGVAGNRAVLSYESFARAVAAILDG